MTHAALGAVDRHNESGATYRAGLRSYFERAVEAGLLAPVVLNFDLERLAAALQPERDLQFSYLGLQTLYDRYLLRDGGRPN